MSEKYYDDHAQEFFESTINADMSGLISKFVSYLKPGARILDAGSGVGRDTKTFISLGFIVSAFDASEEMVRISSEITGIKTRLLKFEDMDYEDEFEGIWACASLLHVHRSQLVLAFSNLFKALKHDGILFVSFKHDVVDIEKESRHFTNFSNLELDEYIRNNTDFKIVSIFATHDVRPNRQDEKWVNAFIKKV